MRDVIITSSILIMAILLIRHLAKGRIHPLLQYSLWLLVVFRFLIPIPLWSSRLSVLNLVPYSLDKEYASTGEKLFSQGEMKNSDTRHIWDIQSMYEHMPYNADITTDADLLPGKPDAESESGMQDAGLTSVISDTNSMSGVTGTTSFFRIWHDAGAGAVFGLSLSAFLTLIWLIGMISTGGYMIFYQIKWQRYLHINRKTLNASQSEIVSALGIPLSVYTVNGLPSPCLCGRSIYLTENMAEDEKQLEHIIVHEYCHYRQFDSLWVIVRCALTVIYWFDPLVWAAAYASKRDSEFACDAAVIRMLGEDERIPYGKTLINLISGNSFDRNKMGAVSMMSDEDKNIRERIFKIAGKPKYIAAAAVVVIMITAALAAVTFSGEYRENDSGQKTEDATDIISEENIENLANTEDDDMKTRSEQLDEAVQQAVKEKEAAIAEELAKIEEMESAVQEEMLARMQAEAEIEQAKLEAQLAEQLAEIEEAELYLRVQAALEAKQAKAEAELAAGQAAEEEALKSEIESKMSELKEVTGAQSESDLSKPLKSEDIQQLLSQAEYTALLPHQSAMQISYINPCPSYTRISDVFGKRVSPITNEEIIHYGVDLAAEKGSDILAAAWGIVCKTGYDFKYGNYVVIYHDMENFTYYTCCAEILVSEGDRVESGQKIATVGSTGRSTGNHLHFMVSDNGEYIEPVFQ